MNLDELRNYDILICNKKQKEEILKKRKLLNIKIYTEREFIYNYLFSYDDNTIIYLMDKYGYCYENTLLFLDKLYYIKDKCSNKKIDFLANLKKELDDNNLLIYNELFKKYVSDKKIVVYEKPSKLLESVIDRLNYQVIDYKYEKYAHDVIEFSNMDEEVEYVCYKICELIDSGINPKNICLTNVSDNYYHCLKRIFSLYNLKVNIINKMPLSSSKIGKIFLKSYDIESISKYEGTLEYNKIIDILNNTIGCNYDKRIINYKMNHTYLISESYDNGIDILDYSLDYIGDKYVFMLGFNEGIIPKTILDTDYISDNICKYTLKDESYIINEKERNNTLNIINNIKNLTITYKLSNNKDSYYPSSLVDNFNIIHDSIPMDNTYSNSYNKLKLSHYMDNYIKYGISPENFKILLNNYKNLYNSFNHKYTKIDRKVDKIYLSYSSLNKYNECAFKYYISYVLKLDKYDENFSANMGSIVHLILKESYNDNFDIEESFNKIVSEYEFNYKELFYLNKYKELLKEVIDTIHKQKEYSSLDKYLLEKEIVTDITDKISFKGIIDKVLYKEEEDRTIVSLIDYKTGSDSISLDYLKYGLNMQLPIYLYLASFLPLHNISYAGFYLQKINENNEGFKLEGYSNSDTSILSYMDNNYMNSTVIKGMKVKNDGEFYNYSKIISNDEINDIITNTYKEIKNKGKMILDNEFNINPKVINNINYGCKYCKYQDICFVSSSDHIILGGESYE